jgi:23S rRNA (uridine2552-2'-O)-methyltransferase
MPKRAGSRRWLQEHRTDPFVKRARSEGYRSRAAYKLMDLDRRYRLMGPGSVVVDLGAAPGGWSKWAAQRVGPAGRVVATDLLDMFPLSGVTFVQGDFRDETTRRALLRALGGARADLVLSDMAPNLSGVAAVDQARSIDLAEGALEVALACLRLGGAFLVKVFQGEGFEAYVRSLRSRFARVELRKPEASRARSREIYVLAREFRGV